MTWHVRFSLVGLLALNVACEGVLGGASLEEGEESTHSDSSTSVPSSDDDPNEGPTEFSCDPTIQTANPGMRRLTRRQYENTLFDLLNEVLGDTAVASDIFGELDATLGLVPDEQRAIVPQDLHGSYRRLDQSVQQTHVDGWYEVGVLAGQILSRDEHLESVVGACATDGDSSNDAACVSDFIRSFGRLALRRPLSDDEVALYETFYAPSTGIDPLGFADVIGGLLNAPQFLYIVEHGDEPTEGDTFQLEAYELASRLSYHFWGTMPDARLFEVAESGNLLLDDATYQAEVERLWTDERTRDTLRGFFLEWMKLEDLPHLDANNAAPVFQAFAGEDLPSAELRTAMMDEVVDLFDFYTWTQPGGIEQIFTTNYSFARTEELSQLYGVPVWDGSSEPPQIEEERPGVLTRAAMLSTGTANTRPVMKGLFIRQNVLCDKIPPPPENVQADPPELSPDFSTRQVVEAITEEEGSGCSSCHSIYMNPLGFTTEGFDGLGRARSAQQLFDEGGTFLGEAEIDTTSIPQVIVGDMTPSSGPADLMTMVVDSGKPTACAVRHYFRFSFGRWEGVVSDGCVLEEMRLALEETGSLASMLRSVALTDAFRRKTFNFDAAEGAE